MSGSGQEILEHPMKLLDKPGDLAWTFAGNVRRKR